MGVTIHHRGGAVPEAVVEEIIRQLEDAFKREGWPNVTGDIAPDQREPYYWKVDGQTEEREKAWIKGRTVSKEIGEREHFKKEYEREVVYGDAEAKKRAMGHVKYYDWVLERLPKVGIPDGFEPTREKGICANPDPHSETFCVIFRQDDTKDSWRDTGDFTKTQFVRSGPGVHVGLCDFLEDVQKKVKAAGGDYWINDEGEYCDDYEGHKHDVREVVKSVNETAKVMDMVVGQLQQAGWSAQENVPKSDPKGEYSPGTLDQWLGADLLVMAPKRGLRLLNRPVSLVVAGRD